MQGMSLFFHELYIFLEFVFVYYATILGFCTIMSVFVLGIIMILRSTVFTKYIFGKGALWCLLIPVIFCGKLHFYYRTKVGIRLFYWWYVLGFTHRWLFVVYFGGIMVAGIWFLTRRVKLKRAVNEFEEAKDYESRYKILIYPGKFASFCTGCFKPVIVIPEGMSKGEAEIVIRHEETHILLGHLWMLLGYEILRALFWPNVFLHICVRYFKRDLENICDSVTIQRNGFDEFSYAYAILKCAKDVSFIRKNGYESEMSFAIEDSYMVLKRRLENILKRKAYKTGIVIGGAIVTLIAVLAAIFGIKEGSFARSNDIGMVSSICYTGNVDKIYTDMDRKIVTGFDDDYIYIDGEALLDYYPEARNGGEWFYISVGGYYKIPGMGGGSSYGEIKAADIHDGTIVIPNHNEIDIWNRIIMWL